MYIIFFNSYVLVIEAFIPDAHAQNMSNPTLIVVESNNTASEKCNTKGEPVSIALDTDKQTYTRGEFVTLYMSIRDDNGCLVDARATVEAIKLEDLYNSTDDISVYKQTGFPDFFRDFGISLWDYGQYKITGSIITNSNDIQPSHTIIEVIEWTQKQFFPFFIVSVLCFLAIIVISSIKRIRIKIFSEALRFLFISGLVFSVTGMFLFVNEEVGGYGPFGLTRINPTQNNSQWIINIGGMKVDNYQSGVIIPVYVFLFGIAGGYLRYLYKTAKMRPSVKQSGGKYLLKWDEIPGKDSTKIRDLLQDRFDLDWIIGKEFVKSDKADKSTILTAGKHTLTITIDDTSTEAVVNIDGKSTSQEFAVTEREGQLYLVPITSTSHESFYRSLEDIALIFLSPLLAIAVYLLLTQGGVNNATGIHMLAAVSFAVGLVTDDVIRALIEFVTSKLGTGDKKKLK